MFRPNDSIVVEKVLSEDTIDERAHNLCASALSKLSINLKANGYDEDDVSIVTLLLEDLLQLTMKYLNRHLSLNESSKKTIEMSEMIQYVSIMLIGNLTGLIADKKIEVLSKIDCPVPDSYRIRYISNHILAYPVTGRRQNNEDSWEATSDATQRLGSFEKAAYEMRRAIFLNPTHALITLDDDLYGTVSRENQVKVLSSRKADKGGHSTHTICDALFRIMLAVILCRRG